MSDKPPDAWYLAPIFLGIIGGAVMWYVLKDEDHPDSSKMVRKGWVIGIVFTLLWFVWIIPFAFMGSMWEQGMMGSMWEQGMMGSMWEQGMMGSMMEQRIMGSMMEDPAFRQQMMEQMLQNQEFMEELRQNSQFMQQINP